MKYDIYFQSEEGEVTFDGTTESKDESTISQKGYKPVPIFNEKPEDTTRLGEGFFLVRRVETGS